MMPRQRAFLYPMTSPLAKAQAADFRRVYNDVQTSFVYSGQTIDCSFSSTDEDLQLAVDGGGEMPLYDLQLTCLIADLPATEQADPERMKGEEITVGSKSYQIEKANIRPGSALVRIMCSNLDI